MKDIPTKSGVIRVQKAEYKGYTFIDIRKMYQDDKGDYKPTKKGCSSPSRYS